MQQNSAQDVGLEFFLLKLQTGFIVADVITPNLRKGNKMEKEFQIDIKRTIPLFADNVLVANLVRTTSGAPASRKNSKKDKREGHISLIFIDSLTKQALARIIITRSVAQALLRALEESLKKFDNIIGKEIKSKIETTSRYFG